MCNTCYPLLLIHGTGIRDGRVNYWGRIPGELERRGARVYFGGQDAWATVERNAETIHQRVMEVLEESGCERVHLIAHSKGGLDARYAISVLDMGAKVASLTTISTPHHGSRTMDGIYRLPKCLMRLTGKIVNLCYRIWGDKNPDFFAVCGQFTTAWAEAFNRRCPDVPGVLYRSCGGVMAGSSSDILMCWQHFIIKWIEGENDGLVTLESARWTNFRPVWRGAGRRGVSHMDEVDFRRKPLHRRGQRIDLTQQYIELVSELKTMGM